MPCALVRPTNHTKTSRDREAEEAKVIFANVKDTGLDLNDIPIVIIHNGLHHFVGAQYPQPTFKHVSQDLTFLYLVRPLYQSSRLIRWAPRPHVCGGCPLGTHCPQL